MFNQLSLSITKTVFTTFRAYGDNAIDGFFKYTDKLLTNKKIWILEIFIQIDYNLKWNK